jgi:hypothetical protein
VSPSTALNVRERRTKRDRGKSANRSAGSGENNFIEAGKSRLEGDTPGNADVSRVKALKADDITFNCRLEDERDKNDPV